MTKTTGTHSKILLPRHYGRVIITSLSSIGIKNIKIKPQNKKCNQVPIP